MNDLETKRHLLPLLADTPVWIVQEQDSLRIVGIFRGLEGAEECADCETSFLEAVGKEGAYTITRSTAWADGTGYHSGGNEKIATYIAGAPSFDIEAKKMLRVIEFVGNGMLSIDHLARYVNFKHEDWVDGLDSRLDQLAWEAYGYMKQYSDFPDKVPVSWVVSGMRDAVEKISQKEDAT